MAVFFDLDGTLFDADYDAMGQAAMSWLFETHRDVLRISEEKFPDRWRFIQEKYFYPYCCDEMTYGEYGRAQVRELFESTSLDLSDDEADRKWEMYMVRFPQGMRLYPDVIPCLDALREMTLGVITNEMISEETRRKLVHVGIRDRFSVVMTSQDAGSRKPAPEIFLAACRETKEDPKSCWYVGDSLEYDALGSQSAGMHGIWLNREEEERNGNGVMVIKDLRELPSLLKEV